MYSKNTNYIVSRYNLFVTTASLKTTRYIIGGFELITCADSSGPYIRDEISLSLEISFYAGDSGCLNWIVNTDSPFTLFMIKGFDLIKCNVVHLANGVLQHREVFL